MEEISRHLLLTASVYSPAASRGWGPGIREEYVIHYVKSGSGFLECGGKSHAVTAGQCFFIAPGTLVRYYPNPEDPWHYAWINFEGAEAASLLRHCAFSEKNPVFRPPDSVLAGLFCQSSNAFRLKTQADLCRNNGYLQLILAYFLEYFPADPGKQALSSISTEAIRFIEANYRQPELTIDTLARALGTNRTTLYRSFLQATGVSPKEYITQARISRACALLKNRNFSVKAISYSVGFSDPLYFSKVFRHRIGLTPTAYRDGFLDSAARKG